MEHRAGPGDRLEAGDSLLSLEQPGGSLEAILYLPPTDAARVQPGMDVQLTPASVKKDEHGLLLGRVATVGSLPASQAGMRQALGSDELATAFSAAGPKVEVRIALERNAATTSGYQWTSTEHATGSSPAGLLSAALNALLPGAPRGLGPSIVLASGTPCNADVVVEREAPVHLILTGPSW
jgi:HlyD family secretion protein